MEKLRIPTIKNPLEVDAKLESFNYDNEEFFSIFSYQSIESILKEFISAITGHDSRCGKRSHLDICNAVDMIHKTTVFIRTSQKHIKAINEMIPAFKGENTGVLDILEVDYESIESNLFFCLTYWIHKDTEQQSDPGLDFTSTVTKQFFVLSDWLYSMDAFTKESKGISSC